MNRTCPNCHKKIEQDEKHLDFCPECSTQLSEIIEDDNKSNADLSATMVTTKVSTMLGTNSKKAKEQCLKAGFQLGDFEVIRLIGKGGMGYVYEARQLSLGRKVALKILSNNVVEKNAELIRHFMLEVRSLASLQHPNIVTVYEGDHKDELLYIAMAFIDGDTVEDRILDSEDGIDEDIALKWCRDVAVAMSYAWRSQHLLHRDIKPGNMLLNQQDEMKLCDLGIAKRPNDEYDISQVGMAIGTPFYISPEQGRGIEQPDFRSDIYNLGATLYHIVTKTLPFQGENPVEVIMKHIQEPLQEPIERKKTLSPEMNKLIMLMMNKDPLDRHPSWDFLIADIDRVREKKDPQFSPESYIGIDDIDFDLDPVEARVSRNIWYYYSPYLVFIVIFLSIFFSFFSGHNELLQRNLKIAQQQLQPGIKEEALIGAKGYDLNMQQHQNAEWSDRILARGVSPDDSTFMLKLYEIRKDGDLPVPAAEKMLETGDFLSAEEILYYCLNEYHGPRFRWAAQAGVVLSNYLLEQKRYTEYEDVLDRLAGLAIHGQQVVASAAILKKFELIEKRESQSNAILYLRPKINQAFLYAPDMAYILSQRLSEVYLTAGKDEELLRFLQYLDSSLPVDFSQRSRIQMDIKTTQERIIEKNKPEEGPALTPEEKKLKDMLDDLAKKKNIQVKAKLHLEIVALLLDMERKEEAIEELRFIVKNYNNKTPVQSGKAAMMLSDIYLEQEDYSKWRLYLNQIIDKKLQGNGEGHILYALESLRDHYLKEEKENMAIPYMKKIAEQYPGQNGQRAAKNLFNIVDIEIQKENFLQAMSLLREIRDEYPGHENVYANKAKKMLVEIKEAHPHLGSLEERSVYAFLNTIRFKSEDRSYLEAKKTISSISKMKSFTFTGWFNQTLMSSRFQVLFSRWNGVGRGVVIGLQSGAVVVMTGDGYQTTTHKTDPFGTSKWFHLAVTLDAGLGKLTVYVDGLNAYEANEVVVENVGAGKTRLGKISLDEDGFYGGRMQFVELHSKVLWSEPFDATKKFIDPKEAIFALEGFEGGLKDLKKNSWYNSNVNKQNQ